MRLLLKIFAAPLIAALALLVWLAFFIISGSLTVPLLRTGFRMVVFSVIIMIVVLFCFMIVVF